MWSQNNWINLICSDVARYGVRSLPAVLWSGGCFTNRERRKKLAFVIFYFHLCLPNCTLSFSKASRQWDAEFKSRLWGCRQGPRSGRHQYYLSMCLTDLVDINICFSMSLWSRTTIWSTSRILLLSEMFFCNKLVSNPLNCSLFFFIHNYMKDNMLSI